MWVHLPGELTPVVSGRLDLADERYIFTYGRSYLARMVEESAAMNVLIPTE